MSNSLKKVLSIDMDLIAWKCIDLYNNDIGEIDGHAEDFWREIEKQKHLTRFLERDEECKKMIYELVKKNISNIPPENILLAEDHDMILEMLCGKKETSGFVYELYNLDHHHDIFYGEQQKENVDRFDFGCLGSWVYYMGVNDKLDKYYWVNDDYSVSLPHDELCELPFPTSFKTFSDSAEELLNIDFDFLFISHSPDFFPIVFWEDFFELKDIIEKEKQIELIVQTDPYFGDGRTRHCAREEEKIG